MFSVNESFSNFSGKGNNQQLPFISQQNKISKGLSWGKVILISILVAIASAITTALVIKYYYPEIGITTKPMVDKLKNAYIVGALAGSTALFRALSQKLTPYSYLLGEYDSIYKGSAKTMIKLSKSSKIWEIIKNFPVNLGEKTVTLEVYIKYLELGL